MAISIPTTKSMPAPDVAALFVQHVVRAHGLPANIVNDRDPIFTSYFWRRLLELLGIQSSRSTAFHPQTAGQTERLNSMLEQYLRIYYVFQQTDWGQPPSIGGVFLQKLQALGDHPLPVLRQLRLPSQHVPPTSRSRFPYPSRGFVCSAAATAVVLQPELLKARKAMEKSANRRRRPDPTLLPGAKVWLLRCNIGTIRPSSKLDVRRLGTFSVIGPVGTSSYRLDLPRAMQIHPVFHVSLLEPHVANTFPGRIQPSSPCHSDGRFSRVRGSRDSGLQNPTAQAPVLR